MQRLTNAPSFDAPGPGETLVLCKQGDRASAYAVGSDLKPRSLPTGQLIAAIECQPDTPALPLAAGTNGRVTAAYEATRPEAASRLDRARRPSTDTRLRRHLSSGLRAAREEDAEDAEGLRRIGVLQQVFLDHLPANVIAGLEEVRRMQLSGGSLIRRLEALRERHRLNPAAPDDAPAVPAGDEVVRIICSDGLVAG